MKTILADLSIGMAYVAGCPLSPDVELVAAADT